MDPIREENDDTLIFLHQSLSENDATNLVKRVNESETITKLFLYYVEFRSEIFKKLCDGITNPRLTTLKLYGHYLGEDGTKSFAMKLPNLTTLEMDRCCGGLHDVIAISSMTKLTTLSLRHNAINDECATILSKLPNLESLDLGHNNVENEGAIALSSMTKLTTLDLSVNSIGDEGAIALSSMTKLTKLMLSLNEIGDVGANALFEIPTLESLSLLYNESITNWDALYSAVESHPTLFNVRFHNDDGKRIEAIQNRKRMRAFCESVPLNDNVLNVILKCL